MKPTAHTRAEIDEVIAEIGKLLTSTRDVKAVYERFASLVARVLPFDRVSLASVDIDAGTITTTYESGLKIPLWAPGQSRPLFQPLATMIIESPDPLIVNHELGEWASTEYPDMQHVLDAGLLSTLAVPVFAEDRPIAFFAVNSRDPDAFGAEEARIASQIVAPISALIANLNLRSELQQQLEERSIQAEIGRLVTSSVELGDMYRTLASLIRDLLPYDRIAILGIDLETELVACEYVDGVDVPGRRTGDRVPLGGSPAELATNERKTIRMEAGPIDRDDIRSMFGINETTGFRSMVITPLFSQGYPIGAISVSSLRSNAYSDRNVDLLERIAAQVGGAIGVAQLHARIQAESAHQVQRLEDLDSLRLQFLQMVTHEFRTPLASLRVSRDLLAETPLSDIDEHAFQRLISNMGRGVDRLDSLVMDLLDLTIAQAGELSLNKAIVNVAELVRNTVDLVAPLASQRNQQLLVDADQPDPVASIDRQRIEQVLINLLSNAQKYSDDGAVINVSIEGKGDQVEFRVTGRGPEIPEADRPHMFEPFFRGTGTRATPGRGLGLSIAKAFVELHGGHIGLDSIPEKGPSFYFVIPTDL